MNLNGSKNFSSSVLLSMSLYNMNLYNELVITEKRNVYNNNKNNKDIVEIIKDLEKYGPDNITSNRI